MRQRWPAQPQSMSSSGKLLGAEGGVTGVGAKKDTPAIKPGHRLFRSSTIGRMITQTPNNRRGRSAPRSRSAYSTARRLPFVRGLDRGQTIAAHFQRRAFRLDVVELRVIAAEDCGLDRTIGRAERCEAVLLLHRLRNFEPAQAFD